MGDRVYASVRIGGHIETIKELDVLVAAIIADGVSCQNSERPASSKQEVYAMACCAVEEDNWLDLHAYEVNNGTFSKIDGAIENNPMLWCSTFFEKGEGFDSGTKTICHIGGKLGVFRAKTVGFDPVVYIKELREILTADPQGIEGELRSLVDKVDRAEGRGLPPLTASVPVSAYLKIASHAHPIPL